MQRTCVHPGLTRHQLLLVTGPAATCVMDVLLAVLWGPGIMHLYNASGACQAVCAGPWPLGPYIGLAIGGTLELLNHR